MINFSEITTALSLINAVFPTMLETIKLAEAAFPHSGQGAAKLALVNSTLSAAANVAGVAVSTTALLTPVINSTVAALNATGHFTGANSVASVASSVSNVVSTAAAEVNGLSQVSQAINA